MLYMWRLLIDYPLFLARESGDRHNIALILYGKTIYAHIPDHRTATDFRSPAFELEPKAWGAAGLGAGSHAQFATTYQRR